MTPLQSYHIALIQGASSNGTLQPTDALLNRSVPYINDRSSYNKGGKKEDSGARRLTSLHAAPETASAAFRPTFEIEINEEDDRDLPKRLLQACINKPSSSSLSFV